MPLATIPLTIWMLIAAGGLPLDGSASSQASSRPVASRRAEQPRSAVVIAYGIQKSFAWHECWRPEPWWPIGGELFRWFDHDKVICYGKDVPALVRNIELKLRAGKFQAIRRVEIWTHGSPGTFRIESIRHGYELFEKPPPETRKALEKLRALLLDDAVVHFRSCSTFYGMRGHAIAVCASRFFCATGKSITIMGHTRPTGLTHPGWKTLHPGEIPDWPLEDGEFETKIPADWIILRDLARVLTGEGYEVVPWFIEQVLPRVAFD